MPIASETLLTLVDLLRRRARESPARRAFTFLDAHGNEAEALTWAGLDERARAVAAALERVGAVGERALLLHPPGLGFITSFLGCLYAGTVAVPAYPPGRNRAPARLRSVAADSRARVVLAQAGIVAGAESLTERVPELAGAVWIATDEIPPEAADPAGSWDRPAPAPDDPAFLQYTSGSTSDPKGVVVTHGNLMDNEEAIRRSFEQSEASIVVGWLPLYHDMGLIGNVLQPLYSGAQAVLMAPLTFLERPARWLEAISRYRATTSGGPSFAYELCARKVSEEEKDGLDLSSWTVAFNGAEPVRAETIDRFAAAFARCGFRREAFLPCYGLAEATLFVSGGRPAEPPVVRQVDAGELERGTAVEAAEAGRSRTLVSSGRAAPGMEVRIADPEALVLLPPGRVGEILVAGPSVAAGYWRRPEETERTFGARLAGGDRSYLRTGDLGFLADGELFVTGRLKDLIILRGRNHYPQDFERTAEASHPALRPGGGAAFSVERGGEERLVILHEVERSRVEEGGLVDIADVAAVAAAIERAVAAEHEVAVEEVVLLRRGTLLKTSSGKVRRAASRAAYLDGELAVVFRSGRPEGPSESGESRGGEGLREVLAAEAARVLRRGGIDPDAPLIALGLDSLAATELRSAVEERTGVAVSLVTLLEGASLKALEAAVRDAGPAGPEVRAEPPPGPDAPGEHPLSQGQRALWLVDRLDPAEAALHLA
ncbi:MAG TPA: AMP-binding protein, partial [Thermoanaerobaculia bacterium]|nr:AMP-binding protein [Thermoanaerobaculia bacterium]